MSIGVEDFVLTTEVDDSRIGGGIFRRRFQSEPPDVPHHIVTFFRDGEGSLWPASYVHFRPWGEVLLVGGAATDGGVFARMSEEQRQAVRDAGGLYLRALRWAFARYADQCQAYFGYCGDPRAWEVDMQAGFVPTPHERLIAHWHRPLPDATRQELIARAHALGPF